MYNSFRIFIFSWLLVISSAHAELPVTVISPDGLAVPFLINTGSDGSHSIRYASRVDGRRRPMWSPSGFVDISMGGTAVRVPVSQISHAELSTTDSEGVWRFTLKDGRSFDGFMNSVRSNDHQRSILELKGLNEFGVQETLISSATNPSEHRFMGVIFDRSQIGDPAGLTTDTAAVEFDVVELRNGDVLSGRFATETFTIRASYGSLDLTKDQISSIAIEDAVGNLDRVVLRTGDRVSGVLENATIEMVLTSGARITLEKGNVGRLRFRQ